MCQSSCPGTQAELYVYHNPGETSDEMVSLSGQPYQALETAYLYKKEICAVVLLPITCQPACLDHPIAISQNTRSDALPFTPAPSRQTQSTVPLMPLPTPKQSAMIDPDTQDLAKYGHGVRTLPATGSQCGHQFGPHRRWTLNQDSRSTLLW